jgi:putative oxidoreductase
MREYLFLGRAARFADCAVLAMRLFIGAFLVWGVWDNIVSSERMHEFVGFLAKFQFPMPDFMARLSVWAQFIIGVSFILGLFTRWAGIFCMINFVVAIAMVDRFAGMRGAFPSACLVAMGLYFATAGAGRFSVDYLLNRNDPSRT